MALTRVHIFGVRPILTDFHNSFTSSISSSRSDSGDSSSSTLKLPSERTCLMEVRQCRRSDITAQNVACPSPISFSVNRLSSWLDCAAYTDTRQSQTDRDTDTQTERKRHTHGRTERGTDRRKNRGTNRQEEQTDRQTDRHRMRPCPSLVSFN